MRQVFLVSKGRLGGQPPSLQAAIPPRIFAKRVKPRDKQDWFLMLATPFRVFYR
jgi:hypothetical protein